MRARARAVGVGALVLGLAWPAMASAAKAEPSSTSRVVPDLGAIRYRDPVARRQAWIGADVGGVAVPSRLTGLGRPVWSVSATPSWALALSERIAIGGRHGMTWYDAQNIRLRVHAHALELSGSPLVRSHWRDRVSLGVDVHELKLATVDGVDFKLGGVRDVAVHVGWGTTHDVTPWLELGWRAHLRHVWVFEDTQRQARLSARAALVPADGHRVALETLGWYVHRNRDQAGTNLPTASVLGQVGLEYAWIGRRGIGVALGGRATTSFAGGEAPIYEIREESVQTAWAEGYVGLRAVWN